MFFRALLFLIGDKVRTPHEKIADKFSELTVKFNETMSISGFTKIERMIWFIIVTRCEIDRANFASVFEQALTKSELVETIAYLKELELFETAESFERATHILDNNGFYNEDGQPAASFYKLHQGLPDEIEILGEKIQEENILWDVDGKLLNLLNLENKS